MNPRLLHSRQILYGLSHHGSPHDPRKTDIKRRHRRSLRFPASPQGLARGGLIIRVCSSPAAELCPTRKPLFSPMQKKPTWAAFCNCASGLWAIAQGPLHTPLSATLRFFKRSGVGGDSEEGCSRPAPCRANDSPSQTASPCERWHLEAYCKVNTHYSTAI